MSLLMYRHTPESIDVVTDTLATNKHGDPDFWATKSFIVPHVGTVIAVTGSLNIGVEWVARVFNGILAQDIDELAENTKVGLHALMLELPKASSDLSVVFHYFGYSEQEKQYVRYRFESRSEFEPKLDLGSEFGIKPTPSGHYESANSPSDYISLAERVQSEQKKRLSDKIHIGGELHLVRLYSKAICCMKLHTFADYEAQRLVMSGQP